ncbi:sulfurtransferase [Falsibacillus albus]|uniref:Sulfurtransferase n=1 Tax=Falsibacillus albus TaxID=2478915 RepID=A0A3L7JWC5_9BACI|nr:sulfurtransferase [Falsibacillus albus]RLQ95157.1 sulfurtransferase [Falsibacillus albus]
MKSLIQKESVWNALKNGENIRVIDCRFSLNDPGKGAREYSDGHIPGAVYFHLEKDLSGDVSEHGGRHPLPSMDDFQRLLEKAGIDRDSKIVIYDSGEGAFASRCWWLLKYAGHKDVFILDGGFHDWKQSQYPIDRVLPECHKTEYEVNIRGTMIATVDEVKEVVQNEREAVLIDSRSRVRYLGLEEPIDRIPGHIPGAINKEWTDALEKGKWKSLKNQQSRFSEINKMEPIIVYCGSGITATPNILTLIEAGYENVKLYPGSYSDWISYPENKVETEQNSG